MKKIFLLLLLPFFLIILLATTLTDDFEIAKNLELFSNIYKEVNIYYVDETDPELLVYAGLEDMLKHMDPYCDFIPADEVKKYQSSLTENYTGLGTQVSIINEYPRIDELYENGPAAKAGLKVGDIITSLDGIDAQGISMSEFSKKARGLEATILTISVLRNGNKINDIAVKRGTIYTPNTPYYGLLKNEVGYIVLSSFTENAAKNVQNALLELKQKSNLKGLVLDLRFNTGGLLNEAVQLASLFIPKGSLVVNTRGTNKSLEKNYKTTQSPIDTDIPLIVLINETSASASEIVAGSLQDYDRAVILGSKSFGKGLVQHVFDLPYGAKVKLTTSKYYLPSGRCIQSKFYQNGKEQELADSLKENFKTMQGRIVVDAAGIIPDISNNNELFYSLLKDPVYTTLKYNFAVQFTNQNKVADPANFQFTDAQFIDFIKYAENAELSQLDKNLNFLQEIESSSKEEGFKKVLDLLPELKKKKLISTLELIKKFPKEIRFDLQQRIVLHTHFQKGRIINSISFDPLIEQACSTITNKKYLSILQKN